MTRDDVWSWRLSSCLGCSAGCDVVRRVAPFALWCLLLFTAPQCVVSSVPWSGRVCLNTPLLLPVVVLWQVGPRDLGGVAANDHTPESRPSSSMCRVLRVLQMRMCCDEVVGGAVSHQPVTVMSAQEVFLSLTLNWWRLSTIKNEMAPSVRWWRKRA